MAKPADVLDDDGLAMLQRELDERLVVALTTDEHWQADELLALGRHLGTPNPYRGSSVVAGGIPEIGVAERAARPDDGKVRPPSLAASFHHDGTAGYVLQLNRVVPETPMSWVSVRDVYADLPSELQRQARQHSAIHAVGEDPAEGPARPLVIDHPRTGLPSLQLPFRRDAWLADSDEEGARGSLCRTLWRAAESSPHRLDLVQQSRTLYAFDNLAVLHCNPPFAVDHDLSIWIMTVASDAPAA